ncbi:hypothetical protein [Candidatus Berkiella aquae]|uniref:Lipoprotein n=1 Tax=Candidatus Berkiella aquae TaxID=295108 RepID=A0A0Q9YEE6_9GAMM|nr:hypothetical protein [Candidatus Berkiella aquae]MCS5711639.1 hypothetical protein [Candidatus Berkiella aquae]
MRKLTIRTLLLGAIFGLSACSHAPSLGEQMLSQGETTEILGAQWIDGDKLIRKGEKRVHDGESKIKKGEKLIQAGKTDIKKGNAMIEKGNKKTHIVEEKFHKEFPNVELENS